MFTSTSPRKLKLVPGALLLRAVWLAGRLDETPAPPAESFTSHSASLRSAASSEYLEPDSKVLVLRPALLFLPISRENHY
jgi:hypothetical protein